MSFSFNSDGSSFTLAFDAFPTGVLRHDEERYSERELDGGYGDWECDDDDGDSWLFLGFSSLSAIFSSSNVVRPGVAFRRWMETYAGLPAQSTGEEGIENRLAHLSLGASDDFLGEQPVEVPVAFYQGDDAGLSAVVEETSTVEESDSECSSLPDLEQLVKHYFVSNDLELHARFLPENSDFFDDWMVFRVPVDEVEVDVRFTSASTYLLYLAKSAARDLSEDGDVFRGDDGVIDYATWTAASRISRLEICEEEEGSDGEIEAIEFMNFQDRVSPDISAVLAPLRAELEGIVRLEDVPRLVRLNEDGVWIDDDTGLPPPAPREDEGFCDSVESLVGNGLMAPWALHSRAPLRNLMPRVSGPLANYLTVWLPFDATPASASAVVSRAWREVLHGHVDWSFFRTKVVDSDGRPDSDLAVEFWREIESRLAYALEGGVDVESMSQEAFPFFDVLFDFPDNHLESTYDFYYGDQDDDFDATNPYHVYAPYTHADWRFQVLRAIAMRNLFDLFDI